jgi:hypothetical protein
MSSNADGRGPGCLAKFLILSVILAVCAVAFSLWWIPKQARKLLESYTATSPTPLPILETTERQKQELARRVYDFGSAVENGSGARLELSADDLNTLMDIMPQYQTMGEHCHFRMEGDKLHTEVSVPLEEAGMKGRYLNANIGLSVSVKDGNIALRPESIKVNGKPIPQLIARSLQQPEHIAKLSNAVNEGIRDNPQFARFLSRIRRLDVENGKLLIETMGGVSNTPISTLPPETPPVAPGFIPAPGMESLTETRPANPMTAGASIVPQSAAPKATNNFSSPPVEAPVPVPSVPKPSVTTFGTGSTNGIIIEGYEPPPD